MYIISLGVWYEGDSVCAIADTWDKVQKWLDAEMANPSYADYITVQETADHPLPHMVYEYAQQPWGMGIHRGEKLPNGWFKKEYESSGIETL